MKPMKVALALLLTMLFMFSSVAFAPKSAEAAGCTHPVVILEPGGHRYMQDSSTQHKAQKIIILRCANTSCKAAVGYIPDGSWYNENHTKGKGISSTCAGKIHTLKHECKWCKYFPIIVTQPCPNPGNCPGLPF